MRAIVDMVKVESVLAFSGVSVLSLLHNAIAYVGRIGDIQNGKTLD
jgi:hypothetical protein